MYTEKIIIELDKPDFVDETRIGHDILDRVTEALCKEGIKAYVYAVAMPIQKGRRTDHV